MYPHMPLGLDKWNITWYMWVIIYNINVSKTLLLWQNTAIVTFHGTGIICPEGHILHKGCLILVIIEYDMKKVLLSNHLLSRLQTLCFTCDVFHDFSPNISHAQSDVQPTWLYVMLNCPIKYSRFLWAKHKECFLKCLYKSDKQFVEISGITTKAH